LLELTKSAKISAALGFDGKWAIHPSQIETINNVFSPSSEELERAHRILEAARTSPGRGRLRWTAE